MEKFFKVSFKAQLIKFALAFKAESQIDIFWKKGQKIAQSQKVNLSKCTANFSQTLEIYCNMVFDHPNKTFKSKITKFQVILYTEKGNKKVGEVHFDVAPYLNQRNKTSKQYQVPMEKCPDPNARLTFALSATIEHQISQDAISNASGQTVNIENMVGANTLTQSTVRQSVEQVPTRDKPKDLPPRKEKEEHKKGSMTERDIPTREADISERIRLMEQENKKIREKLKSKDRLAKENDDFRRKIKNQEYDEVITLRDKIDAGRVQIEKLQSSMKKQILLQKEVKNIEEEILRCKFQIMNAFNYANQHGGGNMLNQMQEACGLKQI